MESISSSASVSHLLFTGTLIGRSFRLSPSPLIGCSCYCALSRMSGGYIFGPRVTQSKAPFMSVPRRPARGTRVSPNPVTGVFAQVGPLSFLTLHPAEKFHGFRDIERLAAREDRLARMGRDPRVG